MIEKESYKNFTKKLHKKIKRPYPTSAQIELTYRCDLNCIHCYCKGSEVKKELTACEWKDLIDQMHSAGTMWLTITGGEPLLRKDFIEIYAYAKKKGFFISLFTCGTLLDDETIRYLSENPPYSVEISLYGVKKETYEVISLAGTVNAPSFRTSASIKH